MIHETWGGGCPFCKVIGFFIAPYSAMSLDALANLVSICLILTKWWEVWICKKLGLFNYVRKDSESDSYSIFIIVFF